MILKALAVLFLPARLAGAVIGSFLGSLYKGFTEGWFRTSF